MTVPHGVVNVDVEIATIGVRDVHADVQARNRQRVGDVDRVGDPDRLFSGIARCGVDVFSSVVGG
jgi:hypothetical protein